MAEQEELSFREAEQVVETDLFLDEYPWWNIGSPTSQLSYMRCSCTWHHEGKKRWNVCAARLPRQCKRTQFRSGSICLASDRVPHIPKRTERPVPQHVSPKQTIRVPLLWRSVVSIQEILSSLWDRLQRQTSSAEAKDAPGNERESAPLPTYEVALQVACQKVMETAKALQSNLDRLDNELRGRPRAHSQGGSRHRTWSRGQHRMRSGS